MYDPRAERGKEKISDGNFVLYIPFYSNLDLSINVFLSTPEFSL